MMNKKVLGIFLLSASAFAAAEAEPKIYAGAGVTSAKLTIDVDPELEFQTPALFGQVGAEFNSYLAGEFIFGTGLSQGDVSVNTVDIAVDLDYFYSANLKLMYGDKVRPHIDIGYADFTYTLEASNGSTALENSGSEGDFTFGAGVDFFLKDELFLNVSCKRYYSDDDATIDGCGIGVNVIL